MKVWVLASLLAATGCAQQEAVSTVEQHSAAAVFHETFSGDFATASLIDSATSVHVNVIDDRIGPSATTYLYYEYTAADPASQVCSGSDCYYTRYISDYGWGDIPIGDAEVTPTTAYVRTTTSATFTTLHCVSEGGYTCGPGTGGTIDLRWERIGTAQSFSSGLFKEVSGPYTLQTHGTFWSSYAQVSGTILGNTLTTTGTLDDSNQTTITKDLFPPG